MRVCFCFDNTLNCTYTRPVLSRIRGQQINITVVVVDQSENPLSSTITRAQFPKDSKGQLGEREQMYTNTASRMLPIELPCIFIQ